MLIYVRTRAALGDLASSEDPTGHSAAHSPLPSAILLLQRSAPTANSPAVLVAREHARWTPYNLHRETLLLPETLKPCRTEPPSTIATHTHTHTHGKTSNQPHCKHQCHYCFYFQTLTSFTLTYFQYTPMLVELAPSTPSRPCTLNIGLWRPRRQITLNEMLLLYEHAKVSISSSSYLARCKRENHGTFTAIIATILSTTEKRATVWIENSLHSNVSYFTLRTIRMPFPKYTGRSQIWKVNANSIYFPGTMKRWINCCTSIWKRIHWTLNKR